MPGKQTLICLLCLIALSTNAQKPVIDETAAKNWAGCYEKGICSDGKYAMIAIRNQPMGVRKVAVYSTESEWKKELVGTINQNFSNDGKWLFWQMGDSLCLLNLANDRMEFIMDVAEYSLPETGNWFSYRTKNTPKDLVFRSLVGGKQQVYQDVSSLEVSFDGKKVLLVVKKDSASNTELSWVDLDTHTSKIIWSGAATEDRVSSIVFGKQSDRLVLGVQQGSGKTLENMVWLYLQGEEKAVELIDDKTVGIEKGLRLAEGRLAFSRDGEKLFLSLESPDTLKINPDAVKVDVWSYRDPQLQSEQLKKPKSNAQYAAVYNLAERKLVRLEQDDESISGRSEDFVLIKHAPKENGTSFESYWNESAQQNYFLVSLKDGSRKLLKSNISDPDKERVAISPAGKWVIWYDNMEKNFFTYEMTTGVIRNITRAVGQNWKNEEDDHPVPSLAWPPTISTWLAGDEAVLIYDTHDIWQVDPSGKKPPLNLTNGYGRRNHIAFRLMEQGDGLLQYSTHKKSVLYLTAINKISKDRGFYKVVLGSPADPVLCSMGPYVYGAFDFWSSQQEYNFPPAKAKNADVFLTYKMSATEYPNYYTTRDFKNFKQLTHLEPQKAFNWLTSELVHWKTSDGTETEGVLYKPENFDSTKKYPVIFNYYEQRSEELNIYHYPGYTGSNINIPWFVSRGYILFVPDIHYKIGEPGPSALRSIVSAAEYLSKFPFVDAKHMGLQGHSFGGYETNFVITQTGLFAAACSVSGISDLVSQYGFDPRGSFGKWALEIYQCRIGATPWQKRQQYIDNSPVFFADKVTTPLLMVNNINDSQVGYNQGVEFFTDLRRLGKKVWMLQYDGNGHSLERLGATGKDFSIRMQQFFDHYLKGAPAPKWMLDGIPANRKQIDDGLELDTNGRTPGPGLNTDDR